MEFLSLGIEGFFKSEDFCHRDWGFFEIWRFLTPGIGDFYPGYWRFLKSRDWRFLKTADFFPGIFIPGDWGFFQI